MEMLPFFGAINCSIGARRFALEGRLEEERQFVALLFALFTSGIDVFRNEQQRSHLAFGAQLFLDFAFEGFDAVFAGIYVPSGKRDVALPGFAVRVAVDEERTISDDDGAGDEVCVFHGGEFDLSAELPRKKGDDSACHIILCALQIVALPCVLHEIHLATRLFQHPIKRLALRGRDELVVFSHEQ